MAVQSKETASLLGDIRTKGTTDITSATELLYRITGETEWKYAQCQQFYDSLLRHYIDDDIRLEMLRAMSGISDGYRCISAWAERREKYLKYLKENNIDCEYRGIDDEAFRKRVDTLLKRIAVQLDADIASGRAQQLIKEWVTIPDHDEEADPQPKQDSNDSSTDIPRINIPNSDDSRHNLSCKIQVNHYYSRPHESGADKEIDDSNSDTEERGTKPKSTIETAHPAQSKFAHKNKWIRYLIIGLVIGLTAFFLIRGIPLFWSDRSVAPEQTIDDPTEEITLKPGEIFGVKPVTPTNDNMVLVEYKSSDPNIVDVSQNGFIAVCGGTEAIGKSAEITIRGDGICQKKIVTIVEGDEELPLIDLEHFEPGYTVQLKVRLSGTKEWKTSIDAEIGDEVEFQAQVRNTGDTLLEGLTFKDNLPTNLAYVPGSSKIYNANYDGASLNDGIACPGIIVGNYTPGSNVYIRFTAKIVDVNLSSSGTNILLNWIQAGVGQININDYAIIAVQKS